MKLLKISLLTLIVLALGWYGLIVIASESGEIVSLYTLDESAESKTTRLWVVEYEQELYLRSGSTDSGWFKRIQNSGSAKLERNGILKSYRPELAPELRESINQSMATKYGWADTFIDLFLSRDDAVPVRLIPLS